VPKKPRPSPPGLEIRAGGASCSPSNRSWKAILLTIGWPGLDAPTGAARRGKLAREGFGAGDADMTAEACDPKHHVMCSPSTLQSAGISSRKYQFVTWPLRLGRAILANMLTLGRPGGYPPTP
jgi:hypothetical protein